MEYSRFLKITLGLQKESRVLDNMYKNGLDLINFVDPYHQIITELVKEVYGEEGYEWWFWFCYENDFGTKGLEARDKDGNLICCGYESLWNYLEKNYNNGIKTDGEGV